MLYAFFCVTLHTYPPMKMEETEVFRNVGI